MSLPSAWVDRIHGRLLVRYGAAWIRMWDGVESAAVKADWAQVLSGLPQEAIAHGIDNLPLDRPPTATQFRDLCRARPPQALALTHDRPAPNPERLAALREQLPAIVGERKDPREWLERLLERRRNGQQLTAGQRDAIERAERGPIGASLSGEFTPPSEDCLPPGMRGAA